MDMRSGEFLQVLLGMIDVCFGVPCHPSVDDHPMSNISRFFGRTTDFIEEGLMRGNGLVVVNCVMGWSRSATVVAAYLMMKKGMSSAEALQTIRQSRPIRPNPGFLQQLADHENLLNKKPFW